MVIQQGHRRGSGPGIGERFTDWKSLLLWVLKRVFHPGTEAVEKAKKYSLDRGSFAFGGRCSQTGSGSATALLR